MKNNAIEKTPTLKSKKIGKTGVTSSGDADISTNNGTVPKKSYTRTSNNNVNIFTIVPVSVWSFILAVCVAIIAVFIYFLHSRMGFGSPFPVQPVHSKTAEADATVLQTIASLPMPPGIQLLCFYN